MDQQFPQPRDPLAREGHRTEMNGLVMASAAPLPAGSPLGAEHRGNLARRYPLTMFLVLVFAIGVPGMVIPLLLGVPIAAGLLWLVFVALLGSSLLVTWLADGRAGVRKLLSRVVLWRFSAWRWAIILFAVPLLTVALAAASGTLTSPERGWAAEIGWYLFNMLIFGALTLNLWEETAWAGFAQSRWMDQAHHDEAIPPASTRAALDAASPDRPEPLKPRSPTHTTAGAFSCLPSLILPTPPPFNV